MSVAFLVLLACGDEANTPAEETTDAASAHDASDEPGDASDPPSDAGHEPGDAEEPRDAEADPDADPDASPPLEQGQIALSGAIAATIENVMPSASWRKSNEQGSLIALPGLDAINAGFTFTFMGPPEQGQTYDQTRSGVTCALIATRMSDNASWDAVHAIQGATDQGSCSVSLTSVVESVDLPMAKQYTVHGSVEGTLLAKQGSGAEGSVTLRASF